MAKFASLTGPESAQLQTSGRRSSAAFSVLAMHADEAALEAYETFCAGMVYSPTQSPLWAKAWLGGEGGNGLLVFVRQADRPVMALALEILRIGNFHAARFAGGQHANGNFPALDPKSIAFDEDTAKDVLFAIRSARPDIDLLVLERQRHSFEGLRNPLSGMPHTTSPNIALAADLSGGFDRLLQRKGRRKRKKHRTRGRKFEAAGGYRLFEARSEAEVDRLLGTFFRLKHERLLSQELGDVFAAPEVRARWRALFYAALGQEKPPFVLHALEVGGKLRAITGSSRTRNSIICEFNTFAQDDLASVSPGEFLFHENILAACAEGLTVYDFSIGDQPYKRLWCDIETRHFDVFAGLTPKGHLPAYALRAFSHLKRAVKGSPRLARLAREVYRNILKRG